MPPQMPKLGKKIHADTTFVVFCGRGVRAILTPEEKTVEGELTMFLFFANYEETD